MSKACADCKWWVPCDHCPDSVALITYCIDCDGKCTNKENPDGLWCGEGANWVCSHFQKRDNLVKVVWHWLALKVMGLIGWGKVL